MDSEKSERQKLFPPSEKYKQKKHKYGQSKSK